MSTSYAPRLYAKEYAGGDRVFEVSYTGQRTRTPFIVYTNAFHGFYNGFQGVYTNTRTSTLAWQSNFAGTYVKSYEGFLNYNSIDTATYTKNYDKANVNFAGTKGYQKEYASATKQPDSIWADANVFANYSGSYSAEVNYSRIVNFQGVGGYDGAAYTATYTNYQNYVPTYSGFIGFVGYTKDYVGTISYNKDYQKTYVGTTIYQAEWQRNDATRGRKAHWRE